MRRRAALFAGAAAAAFLAALLLRSQGPPVGPPGGEEVRVEAPSAPPDPPLAPVPAPAPVARPAGRRNPAPREERPAPPDHSRTERSVVVEGRVVGLRGEPVPGATVLLLRFPVSRPGPFRRSLDPIFDLDDTGWATTGSDGSFRFETRPIPVAGLIAWGSGHANTLVTGFSLEQDVRGLVLPGAGTGTGRRRGTGLRRVREPPPEGSNRSVDRPSRGVHGCAGGLPHMGMVARELLPARREGGLPADPRHGRSPAAIRPGSPPGLRRLGTSRRDGRPLRRHDPGARGAGPRPDPGLARGGFRIRAGDPDRRGRAVPVRGDRSRGRGRGNLGAAGRRRRSAGHRGLPRRSAAAGRDRIDRPPPSGRGHPPRTAAGRPPGRGDGRHRRRGPVPRGPNPESLGSERAPRRGERGENGSRRGVRGERASRGRRPPLARRRGIAVGAGRETAVPGPRPAARGPMDGGRTGRPPRAGHRPGRGPRRPAGRGGAHRRPRRAAAAGRDHRRRRWIRPALSPWGRDPATRASWSPFPSASSR